MLFDMQNPKSFQKAVRIIAKVRSTGATVPILLFGNKFGAQRAR